MNANFAFPPEAPTRSKPARASGALVLAGGCAAAVAVLTAMAVALYFALRVGLYLTGTVLTGLEDRRRNR